ncbi:hypothetical protein AWM75_05465 [Aerococcus urinaehominis]|uniref:Uncharacterized protein n=1 Tax=Aerococcus urinaehominis TaxID=128944 RepID=A0A120IAX8_9LACT|nr:LytTR family DNA-binding domain-containing protein [Aerococcus urinaehominis]AMB99476.1 hypothetical protein AWM75_05465 [Aerococcus urinaehominis]SDM27097.1 two component transcriptional regulator, LytTR family [Aerococcus urinaehominis]
MFDIIICEDNDFQRDRIQKMVENYLLMADIPAKLDMVSQDSYQVLAQAMEKGKDHNCLYFLDIELGDQMNGLELARQLRERQPLCKIAFVTAFENYLPFTMKYHLEAMDYIMKDQADDAMRQQVIACLNSAAERFIESASSFEPFVVAIGTHTRLFASPEINYFETLPAHRIRLVGTSDQIDFYDTLANIEENYPQFIRTHRSYLANIENIKLIDHKEKLVLFQNGDKIPLSRNRVKAVVKALTDYQKS